MKRSLRIIILHPDLGLGGAERVVVDAALEMQVRGHRVTIYTLHHDLDRCFEETRNGTLDIVAAGSAESLGSRGRAPLTIWRMARLARDMLRREADIDAVFCDHVAHIVPLLHRRPNLRVLFYCHYPDRLLVHRNDPLYRVYRWPIDRAEEIGMCSADRVMVNSKFTAESFRRAFPRVRVDPDLLYPGVCPSAEPSTRNPAAVGTAPTILSLSRFDPAKNLELAIEAFSALGKLVDAEQFRAARLIMAGSCDARLVEQESTLRRLRDLADARGLSAQVTFRTSITDDERLALLAEATCLVYTPQAEHFGLAPIEAMAAGVPVVAVDAGGVRETVRAGETGLLCPPEADAFAQAIASLLKSPQRARDIGAAARVHVENTFSRRAFGSRLDAILDEICG